MQFGKEDQARVSDSYFDVVALNLFQADNQTFKRTVRNEIFVGSKRGFQHVGFRWIPLPTFPLFFHTQTCLLNRFFNVDRLNNSFNERLIKLRELHKFSL